MASEQSQSRNSTEYNPCAIEKNGFGDYVVNGLAYNVSSVIGALAAEVFAARSEQQRLAPHTPDAEVKRLFMQWQDQQTEEPSWCGCYVAGFRKANEIEFAANGPKQGERSDT